jgi:hypothetical protein
MAPHSKTSTGWDLSAEVHGAGYAVGLSDDLVAGAALISRQCS